MEAPYPSNNLPLWWLKLLKLRLYTEGLEVAQAAVLHQQFQVISLLCFVPADPIEMTTERPLLGSQGACLHGKFRYFWLSRQTSFF